MKKQYRTPPEVNRGYAPPTTESLSLSLGLAPANRMHDFFEAFNVGAAVSDFPGLDLPVTDYPDNVWPAEAASFRDAVSRYFDEASRVARTLTTVFADALGLPERFFERYTDHSLWPCSGVWPWPRWRGMSSTAEHRHGQPRAGGRRGTGDQGTGAPHVTYERRHVEVSPSWTIGSSGRIPWRPAEAPGDQVDEAEAARAGDGDDEAEQAERDDQFGAVVVHRERPLVCTKIQAPTMFSAISTPTMGTATPTIIAIPPTTSNSTLAGPVRVGRGTPDSAKSCPTPARLPPCRRAWPLSPL